MFKKLLLVMWAFFAFSQITFSQVVTVNTGAAYSQQVFYSFENGTVKTIDNDDWDIAFSVYGQQDAAIFINESTDYSYGTVAEIQLYEAPVQEFNTEFTIDDLSDRLYNQEKNWNTGAFNENKNPADPFDYGWGVYNPATNTVEGSKVYLMVLKDGSAKKIMIEALNLTTYSFRYADFDGSNEITATIDKNDFQGQTLAYYSIANNEVLNANAAEWDLLFTRYATPLDDGYGNILEYNVTGVLLGKDIEAAVSQGVLFDDVNPSEFQNELVSQLDIIGHDWKFFDLNSFEWLVDEDAVYIIKLRDGSYQKINFIDFEGSSTGVISFITESAVVTSVNEINNNPISLYPNPVIDKLNINSPELIERFEIYNSNGALVLKQVINALQFEIPFNDVSKGVYIIRMYGEESNTVYQELISK